MSVASTTLYLPKALFVLGRGGGLAQYAQTDVARSQRSNSVVPDPANLQRDRPVVQSTDDGCAALFEVGTHVGGLNGMPSSHAANENTRRTFLRIKN
jgi:hypothetical protein